MLPIVVREKEMDSKIKNVIFDVGDVLIDFRYRDYMKDLGFSDETVDFLSDNMVLTDFWDDMDLGVRDVDDAEKYFSDKYPDLKDEIHEFWAHTERIVAEYDYAGPMIRSLKDKGYKVFLLSNYPEKMADIHWKKFTFLDILDGYIISAKVKITKPDPAIYRMLMDRYRLKPEESIFIDDRQINIDTAKELGMETVLFTGYDELAEKLGGI